MSRSRAKAFIMGRLKGRSPFKSSLSPSCKEDIPIMERGTKVGSQENLPFSWVLKGGEVDKQ